MSTQETPYSIGIGRSRHLFRFTAFLVIIGLFSLLQLLSISGISAATFTEEFSNPKQRSQVTVPRNPDDIAKALEISGLLKNIRAVQLDGVTTTVVGNLITLHNLRVLSDKTSFEDYLSVDFILDLQTLHLVPINLEITPDLGLYYRDEQLFSKDVLSDIFLMTSDGRTLAPDRLHKITAGSDDKFTISLEAGTVLTMQLLEATDDYELQINQPDGKAYERNLFRSGSKWTAFGRSILQSGLYTFRFMPQNKTKLTLQFGFTNNNRLPLSDVDSGGHISVSLKGWGHEYAKYRLHLNAGDLVEVTEPVNDNVWLYLLDSNSHNISSGGGEIFTRTPFTGTYYLFVMNRDFNNGADYSGTVTITPDPNHDRYPVLDSIPQQLLGVGQSYFLQLSASNTPTKFSASGLPTGLSINETNGVISGTTEIVGTFPVLVAVENKFGHDRKTFLLTVQPTSAQLMMTATPFLTATTTSQLKSTATPLPTTNAIPQTLSSPPPGWQKFATDDVELWLPDGYVDAGAEIQQLLGGTQDLRGLPADCEQILQTSDQNLSAIKIFAVELTSLEMNLDFTSLIVAHDQLLPSMTLDTWTNAMKVCSPYHLIENRSIPFGAYEARRLIFEAELLGIKEKQVAYVVADGLSVWTLIYSTGAEKFEENLPTFEQSFHTFKIRSKD